MLVLLALLTAAGASAQGPDEIAGAARTYLAAHTSLRGRFTQSYWRRATGARWVSRGRLALARPGRARFDYDGGRVFVSDGARWVGYEPIEGAGGQHASGPVSEELQRAIGLLTGATPLDDYAIALRAPRSDDPAGTDALLLTPRRADPRWRSVTLSVERAGPTRGRVLAVGIETPDGDWNRFFFHDLEVDPQIPDETFRYTPPAGSRPMR